MLVKLFSLFIFNYKNSFKAFFLSFKLLFRHIPLTVLCDHLSEKILVKDNDWLIFSKKRMEPGKLQNIPSAGKNETKNVRSTKKEQVWLKIGIRNKI